MTTADYHGRADLRIAALAHDLSKEIGEVPPLASASVTILGTRLKSLEGALIHALYVLDDQLAESVATGTESG
jgi:putative effector of murein hydrolase